MFLVDIEKSKRVLNRIKKHNELIPIHVLDVWCFFEATLKGVREVKYEYRLQVSNSKAKAWKACGLPTNSLPEYIGKILVGYCWFPSVQIYFESLLAGSGLCCP